MKACSAADNEAVDGAAAALAVVDAAGVAEDAAAVAMTEAIWTVAVADVAGAASAVEAAALAVVAAAAVPPINVLIGTTGVGAASKRENMAKFRVSGLLSDTVLPLLK